MNWSQILEKSWRYLVGHRYLVWLGVLAALTTGGTSFSGVNYKTSNKQFENSEQFRQAIAMATNWLNAHSTEIIIAIVALFLIGIIILYISYSAQAGLIHGVNALELGKESNFHHDFEAGKKFFWRLLGLRVLIALTLALILILLVLLLIGGFVLVVSYSEWLILPIVLFSIPAVSAFILLAVYLSLSSVLAERYIVINNLPLIQSIDEAIHIVRAKIATIIVAWLINLLITTVGGFIYLVVIIIPVTISILVGSLAYVIGKEVGLIVAIVLAIILTSAVTLLAKGILATYLSAYWTIVYKRLVESP